MSAPVTTEPELTETILDKYADQYGPEKIVYVYEPRCNLRGIVVIHNTAIGPAIGGVRMMPNVSTHEVYRLAEAMTWKNSLAGIPHGGGKSGIIADARKLTMQQKETLIRQFARAIEALEQYIPGPDMGTDETAMAWIRDEIRRSVGLSRVLGGIPLDQVGATGFGLAICGQVVEKFTGAVKLDGATVSVQGFGNVGQHVARYMAQHSGTILTTATDLDGTIYNKNGIDVEELVRIKIATGGVTGYADAEKLDRDAFVDLPCDIFIPAAQQDVVREDNAERFQCKVILQGANNPVTPGAEQILHDRDIISMPDFVANAGGVICGSVEFHGGNQDRAFEEIESKMRFNSEQVIRKSQDENILLMDAAKDLARKRVEEAMSYRRSS